MKIAINECYGGFSISEEVAKKLRTKYSKITKPKYINFTNGIKKSSVHLCNEDFNIKDDDYNKYRINKDLIEAIENTENPSGALSNITIVNIPDDVEYTIWEYDGIESIHEVHKEW